MKTSEFLVELEDILQREEPCNLEDNLNSYEEWDSLSKMAVMAYYKKKFNVEVTISELKAVEKVSQLVELAGENVND